MRRLNRERGLTFLIVTHDISVGRATDRIVRMVDGEIVGEELLQGGALMVARVTLAEVDAVRMSIDAALELYRASVIPGAARAGRLRGLLRPHDARGQGAGADVLGATRRPPMPGSRAATTREQVEKFVTFFRSPPGRETYDVGVADAARRARRESVRS